MSELIPAFIQEDDTVMDAYEAREAYEQANKARALVIARDLRKRAQKLLEHAQKLEAVGRAEDCPEDDPRVLLDSLLDPSPDIPVAVGAEYRFLDPACLEYLGVHDLGDTSVLRKYIGSYADVTEKHIAETRWSTEAFDELWRKVQP